MRNVGTLDRNIRLGIFVALLAVGILQDGVLRWVLWGLSGVMLVTATIGFCPVWALFKMSTIKK